MGANPDTLQARLDAHRRQASADAGPDEITDEAAAALEARLIETLGVRPLRAGDRAPDFELPNVKGRPVRLGDLLGRGAVVLTFYRGVW
jgi:AhpC/TSA family